MNNATDHIEDREGDDSIYGDAEVLAVVGPRTKPMTSAADVADYVEGGGGHMGRCQSITALVASLLFSIGAGAGAAEHSKPTYKITEGKGYTLCEAYLRNLRAFQPAEKSPVCAPRPHSSSSDFREIAWTPMEIDKNLELIYKVEMSWGPYANHPERHPPYSAWREEFEAKLQSGAIRPSLKRASIEFAKGRVDTFLAYARNPDGCEMELATQGYSESVGHRIFPFDESKGLLKRVRLLSRSGGEILLFKGRPIIVNALLSAKDIYVWEQLRASKVFQPQRLCHIESNGPK